MSFDIDVPSGGGNNGPFIAWQSKEALDGSVPGRVWVMREAEGKTIFKGFENGVVFDVENMQTGWCWSNGAKGTAPEWKWNASITRFEPMPPARSDIMWKRGIRVPLAYRPTNTAVWEQAQAGAWSAFVQFAGPLKAAK